MRAAPIPQDDDDADGGQFELTEMGTSASAAHAGAGAGAYRDDPNEFAQEVDEFNYRPTVRRQNFCCGVGLTCVALAAAIYFVAGAYFINGEAGVVSDYNEGSGEVGNNADNAKMQQYLNTEEEEHHQAQGKWKNGEQIRGPRHPFAPWGKKSKNRPFGRNKRNGPGIITPGPDGICRLNSGRKVPCPNGGGGGMTDRPFVYHQNPNQAGDSTYTATSISQPTQAPIASPPSDDTWWIDPRPHDKVSLSDGPMYEVLEEMQHDHESFTQGLTYGNGLLYESVGLYKKSKIRQLDPTTGEVLKSVDMDRKYFAEGMTYYDEDKLIQITWKTRQGFIYNASTLETISEYTFTTTTNEGWGITFDPRDRTLIVSDGSEYLHFWDPDNPGVDKKERVKVIRQNPRDDARELNELEFVNGKIIANVWYKDILLVINPETGECELEYDFKDLWPKYERRQDHADVLNGVSISGEEGVLYVTGKLWKKMFRLKLK